jgi:hypothetical protein
VATLDFETAQFYTFMVMACDRGTPMQCEDVPVRINIGDFNDQIPTFDQNDYRTDVCSEAALGTPLVQPVAVDSDSGTNAQLQYSLENNPSIFNINSSSGRISLAQEPRPTDFSTHVFTVVAEDMGGTRLSSSAQVNIRVFNCTEQDFYFQAPFHYFEIVEGTNRFTDGSGSLTIDLSRTPQEVFFAPRPALPTNPFSNVLNVSLSCDGVLHMVMVSHFHDQIILMLDGTLLSRISDPKHSMTSFLIFVKAEGWTERQDHSTLLSSELWMQA